MILASLIYFENLINALNAITSTYEIYHLLDGLTIEVLQQKNKHTKHDSLLSF